MSPTPPSSSVSTPQKGKTWVSLSSPCPIPCPQTRRLLALPNELLTTLCALALSTAAIRNDDLPTKGAITRFHAKEKLELGLKNYLDRLRVYTPYPRDAILLSLLYLDRVTRLPLDPPIVDPQDSDHARMLASQAVFLDLPKPTLAGSVLGVGQDEGSAKEEEIPLIPTPEEEEDTDEIDDTASSSRSPPPTSSSPPKPSPSSPPPATKQKPVSPSIRSPTPLLNSYTLHRLLASSLLVSSKFTSDGTLPQARAAKVAGVDKTELVRLEVEFLKSLDWELGWTVQEVEWVSGSLLKLGEEKGLVEGEVEQESSEDSSNNESNLTSPFTTPARSDEGHEEVGGGEERTLTSKGSEETVKLAAEVEGVHLGGEGTNKNENGES